MASLPLTFAEDDLGVNAFSPTPATTPSNVRPLTSLQPDLLFPPSDLKIPEITVHFRMECIFKLTLTVVAWTEGQERHE